MKDEDFCRYLEMSKNNNYYGKYIVNKNLIKKEQQKLHTLNNYVDNKSGLFQGGKINDVFLKHVKKSSSNNKNRFQNDNTNYDESVALKKQMI